MKNIKIPLTEEEIKAIRDYTGFKHTKINIIADMNPNKIKKLTKQGWLLNETSEELMSSIQDFVNIYSAIYKSGNTDSFRTFYRGTTKNETNNMSKNSIINSIYSHSYSEDIAKQFTEYDNAAIIRTRLQKGLPYLDIESLKDEDRKNEEEVLILPFAKVKRIDHTSDWNGFSYYDMVLEKEELPELEMQDIEILKDKCLNNFESHIQNTKKYNLLHDEIEFLYMKEKRLVDREDKIAIYEKLREYWDKASEYKKNIDNYLKDFSKMLKASCRQKEIEIDKQREEIAKKQEEIQKRIEEQRRKEEKQRIESLKTEIRNTKNDLVNRITNITNNVEENIMQLEINASRYAELAERLSINYTQKPEENFQEIVNSIKQNLEDKKNEIKDKEETENIINEFIEIDQQEQYIKRIEKKLVILPNLVSNHYNQSMQEIKYNLNAQVRDMIYRARIYNLQEEKNQILSQKDNLWQKITGRNKLKEEQLKNIELRMNLALKDSETMNPENKVSQMLEEIYGYAYEDLDGVLSQDMLDTITKIRENFGNLPKEEVLHEKARERASGKYLSVVQDKNPIFKKRKISEIREQNKMVESQIKKVEDRPKRKPPTQMDTISNIKEGLSTIHETVDRDEYILFEEKEDYII